MCVQGGAGLYVSVDVRVCRAVHERVRAVREHAHVCVCRAAGEGAMEVPMQVRRAGREHPDSSPESSDCCLRTVRRCFARRKTRPEVTGSPALRVPGPKAAHSPGRSPRLSTVGAEGGALGSRQTQGVANSSKSETSRSVTATREGSTGETGTRSRPRVSASPGGPQAAACGCA